MIYSYLLNVLRTNNPFAVDKVIDPWEDNYPNVATINARPFHELSSLVAQKANNPALDVGAFMEGDSGSGKTHMIKRIAETVHSARRPLLVANVQPILADPKFPFSYLLREIIGSLQRPMVKDGSSATQMDRLISLWLLEMVSSQLSPTMAAKFQERPERILNSDLSDIDFDSQPIQKLPKELVTILQYYHKPRLRSCVVDWLAGNTLTPECADAIKVRNRPVTTIKKREIESLDLLIAIGEILTQYNNCLLVCFDQWEKLVTLEQIKATEYMIGELFDSVKGMLPVAMVPKSDWEENFSKTLNQYVVSRLENNRFVLRNCNREDAFNLIRARLAHSLKEDVTDIEPFTQDQLDNLLGIGNLSPRAVLNLSNKQLGELLCQKPGLTDIPPHEGVTERLPSQTSNTGTDTPPQISQPITGDMLAMLPDICVNILKNGPIRMMSCGALCKRVAELGYIVEMQILLESLNTHTERFEMINSKDDTIVMLNAEWLNENLSRFS